jgi:hypothetical protein
LVLVISHGVSVRLAVAHIVRSELTHAGEHVPEDTDLFLVELGINDLVEMNVIDKFENLVRSLLELDSEPAIINLE